MSTETYSTKISAKISIKWSLLGVLFYVIPTVIGSAVLTSVWMSNNDIAHLSPQEIGMLMERDTGFAVYASLLAALSAVFCGWLATKKGPYDNYYTAMVIGLCLSIYGVVSIIVHPDHQLLHHVGKIVAPFLLCATGAKLAMWNRH